MLKSLASMPASAANGDPQDLVVKNHREVRHFVIKQAAHAVGVQMPTALTVFETAALRNVVVMSSKLMVPFFKAVIALRMSFPPMSSV